MNSVSSARVVGCGVRPSFVSESRTPGSLSTFTTSWFQRSSSGAGVLPGATKAYQLRASKPGYPDSATVGMLGRYAGRVGPVVPSAMSLPASMCGRAVGGAAK